MTNPTAMPHRCIPPSVFLRPGLLLDTPPHRVTDCQWIDRRLATHDPAFVEADRKVARRMRKPKVATYLRQPCHGRQRRRQAAGSSANRPGPPQIVVGKLQLPLATAVMS